MSNMPASDNQAGAPASISAQFTLFFDGRFWVGVLELHERRRGAEANDQGGAVRAARYVFGAEPSDAELYDFLLTHGGALIDRAAASPPAPVSRPVGSSSTPRPNPKRTARQAAKEAARARPSTAAQAALADRAGDLMAARGAELLRRRGVAARLFKNNVDGKGATYGTHENYLVPRAIDFDDLVQALVPLLVVRPLLVGSGRVGTGAVAQNADFQISQRADYLEKVVGLGTTVNRPLVNTRDEPHADPERWRRLHLVAGDANCFDTMNWLKLGMTSLVLQVLADGVPASWRRLRLADPRGPGPGRLPRHPPERARSSSPTVGA